LLLLRRHPPSHVWQVKAAILGLSLTHVLCMTYALLKLLCCFFFTASRHHIWQVKAAILGLSQSRAVHHVSHSSTKAAVAASAPLPAITHLAGQGGHPGPVTDTRCASFVAEAAASASAPLLAIAFGRSRRPSWAYH
jgi:hypothetical protein